MLRAALLFVGLPLAVIAITPEARADSAFGRGGSEPRDSGPSLSTLAAATDRPAECGALQSKGAKGRRANIWRLSKSPYLGAYCDAIARAHALLESDPEGALAAAALAEATLPNHASSFAAMGRAHLALGHVADALDAFETAKKLDARALDEPKAMNDYAWTLVRAGRAEDATPVFRALVPRANLLPDRARALVYVRGAFVLMAHAAANPSSATADFADAQAYLSEARADASSPLYADALLAAVLVYDRAGETAKASAALDEARRVHASAVQEPSVYVALESDALAVVAVSAEVSDPAGAGAAWQQYLDAKPPEPFAKPARDRRAGAGKPKPPKANR